MISRFKLDLFNPEFVVLIGSLEEAIRELNNNKELAMFAKELEGCEHLQGVRIFATNDTTNVHYILIWVEEKEDIELTKETVVHECVHAGVSLFRHHGQCIEDGEEIFAMTVEKLYSIVRRLF